MYIILKLADSHCILFLQPATSIRSITQLEFMAAAPLQPSTSGSRSRPQARKKPNDDASYFGPALGSSGAAGTKRQAADKVEGEPRGKRKRVEPVARRDAVEHEQRASLVRAYSAANQ